MKCPYCMEVIKKGSLKCKHCQADLMTDEAQKKLKEANEGGKTTFITTAVVLFMVFWGLASLGSGVTNPPTSPSSSQGSCYSEYSGVHKNGEKALKASLKDPDSYEHIETRYDGGKAIIKFRAKNSFGGYDVQYFEFDTDADCSVRNGKTTR